MKNRYSHVILAVAAGLACFLPPTIALAQISEETSDFSNDPLNPEIVGLSEGITTISGSVQAPNDRNDFLILAGVLSPAHYINAIYLTEYVDGTTGETGNTGFIHIDARPTTEIPGFRNVDNFLGVAHLDRFTFPVGENMLDVLGRSELGGQGFSSLPSISDNPLIFNIQQTGEQLTNYTLEFHVSTVPEPRISVFWLAAIAGWIWRRHRR